MSEKRSQKELNEELGKAVMQDDVEAVGHLLHLKANVNYSFYRPGYGHTMTVLMSACRDGYKPLVELLMRHGVDIHKRAQNGWTALHSGARGGHGDVVQLLVENHADINVMDKNGNTPLHFAAANGYDGTVKVLLQFKADASIANKNGQLPLHKAALYGYDVAVHTLLQHNANPNVVDENGSTPLHYAASYGHAGSAKVLLQFEANANIANKEGKTALQVAEAKGYGRVFEVLKGSGPEMIDVSDSWSMSDVMVETEQSRPAPVTSVSAVVDEDGGECKSPHVTLVVPRGAVSSSTAISADIYADHFVTPPVNVEEQVVLSPVVHLSPSGLCFSEPIELSFPPHVPLKSSTPESASVLELKMTDTSPDDPSCQWYTALEINTFTGEMTKQHPDVHFDVESGQVQMRHFCAICWIGKLLGGGVKSMRSVLYAAFGKKLESHKWNILIEVIDTKKLSYESIVDSMKKNDFISLSPPSAATVDRHSDVTLKFEFSGLWQLCLGNTECQISAETIDGHYTYAVAVEDPTASSKSLLLAVNASCTSKGKPVGSLSPSMLLIGYPLEETSADSKHRDHFHCLVVCPQELELQAAQRVFEHGTNKAFVQVHHDLPFNVRLCRDWMSSPSTTVALVAQAHRGGIECMKLVPQLSKYFSADLIAMAGICAGEENKYGCIEHGCVVVARRTTTVSGGKITEDDQYQTHAQYKEVNTHVVPSLSQLVEEGGEDWLNYVPEEVRRPSPRYVRELILHEVRESGTEGIAKRQLLSKLEELELPGMTRLIFDEFLNKMTKQANAWVQSEGQHGDIFIQTPKGEEYVRNAVDFPRKDNINVVFDSMGTISHYSDNLDLLSLRQQMGDRKLKGIDQESYYFMEQVDACFDHSVAIVMKGIADYGTNISKLDYYQRMAAATSAAFLRHCLTQRNALKQDEERHDATLLPPPTRPEDFPDSHSSGDLPKSTRHRRCAII